MDCQQVYQLFLDKDHFTFCIPLRFLLGFDEDYKYIIFNVKPELLLIGSSTDKNEIVHKNINPFYKHIASKIVKKIPYIEVDDKIKLCFEKKTNK